MLYYPTLSSSFSFHRSADEMSAWIESSVCPDVYAVVHLKRSALGQIGNSTIYDNVASAYLARISCRIFGPKGFRKRPHGHRLIPNAVTLEKLEDRPHLNIHLRCPGHLEFTVLRDIMEEEWSPTKTPWASDGRGTFWCEQRDPEGSPVHYSLKEGSQALLEGSFTPFQQT